MLHNYVTGGAEWKRRFLILSCSFGHWTVDLTYRSKTVRCVFSVCFKSKVMLVVVDWRLVTLMSCSHIVVGGPLAETKGLGRLGGYGVTYDTCGWHSGCFRPEVFLSDFAPGPKAWCATIAFACSSRRVVSLVSSHVVPECPWYVRENWF